MIGKTPYELQLISQINDLEPERVVRTIKSLIDELANGRSKRAFYEPNKVRKLIRLEGNKYRIKNADLRYHIRNYIIPNLSKSSILENRAIVIYKQIHGLYRGDRPKNYDDIEKGIERIRKKKEFSPVTDSNALEGTEDTYRALDELFINEKTPKPNTLLLAISVLGIRPSYLSVKRKTSKPIIGIAVLVLIALSFFLVRNFDSQTEIRQDKLSSNFFLEPDYVITDFKDSVSFEILSLLYNEVYLPDSIPANALWVRIKTTNHSQNRRYFPDGFITQSGIVEQLNNDRILEISKITAETNLAFNLPDGANQTLEWQLINDEKFRFLPPKTAVLSFIKLTKPEGAKNGIYTLNVGLKGHYRGQPQKYIEAQKFKLAFEN